MSSIFFIRNASKSANFKTKIWRIYITRILSEKSSLYVISPRTFTILKSFSFREFNLSLSLIIWINIIFIISILFKRYTLFLFFKAGP